MKRIISTALLLFTFLVSFSQSISKTMAHWPDTGETTSYTTTFGEDSDYNIFTPFFSINENGTVTDTITGLMWQQTDGGEMTIENAILYCSTLTLGGYSDWRLPNAHESFSILNHQNVNPAIDASVFTVTLAEYWWTSDRQANDSNKVWVTNAGGGIGNHPKTETTSAGGTRKFHVRAVRDVDTPPVISDHFINNGNGTITDNLTGLIWQGIPTADTLTWEQSLVYADALSLNDANDWRLPNIKELFSINDETLINPSLDANFFNVFNAQKYWSSTSLPNETTKAWYLDTQYGITTHDFKTNKHNLICVRGNQIATGNNDIQALRVSVFPNPFTSRIYLKNKSEGDSFELSNSLGENIYSGKNIEQQNFSSLTSGIYFLKVVNKATSIIKLIKE